MEKKKTNDDENGITSCINKVRPPDVLATKEKGVQTPHVIMRQVSDEVWRNIRAFSHCPVYSVEFQVSKGTPE